MRQAWNLMAEIIYERFKDNLRSRGAGNRWLGFEGVGDAREDDGQRLRNLRSLAETTSPTKSPLYELGASMSRFKSSLVAAVALLFCLTTAQHAHGQEIVVTLLGTGSPIPEIDRVGPIILAQAGVQTLIFDVGRGAH